MDDRVERAVHKVRCLWYETGKAVTGQVKGKVSDTSFLAVHQNHTFCYYLFV